MYNSLIKRLIKDNISISFAESCTGGALVSALTKIAGVSKILEGSFITYSNEFKVKELGVKEETINEFGVVSAEVAHEMVEGLYNKTNAKLCISTTGNAGPTKGDLTKDLGDVYVGIMYEGYTNIYALSLMGTRIENINAITAFVYQKIEELVYGKCIMYDA